MATHNAEDHHPSDVEDLLHDSGFTHLRARKRGAAVLVESGPERDAVKHFRVRRDTVHLWVLDIADHRGRWERTPFRDTLPNLVATVIDQFSWTLADQA